jgi:hypothetical protein
MDSTDTVVLEITLAFQSSRLTMRSDETCKELSRSTYNKTPHKVYKTSTTSQMKSDRTREGTSQIK